MNYKLLCTDMDGTLLTSEKKISDRTIRAVKLAYEKGVKIAVCTGRLFTSAHYYAELIGVRTPVISSNGAYIREKDRDEVIYKELLGKDNCRKIYEVTKKYGIIPQFHTTNAVFTEKFVASAIDYNELNKTLPTDKHVKVHFIKDWESIIETYGEEFLKAIAIDEDLDKIACAKKELSEDRSFEVVSSHLDNFEVNSAGVSKGKAVRIIAAYYGFTREQVICIGDNENDISMIEYAGLGVAMGNGDEKVKSIANFITDDNDHDGVAAVIEKFLL